MWAAQDDYVPICLKGNRLGLVNALSIATPDPIVLFSPKR
jgi:hypothetical protein